MKKFMKLIFAAQLTAILFIVCDIWKILRMEQSDDGDGGDEGGGEWPLLFPSPDGQSLEWWVRDGNLTLDRFALSEDA